MRRPIVSKSERSGTGVDMANRSKAVCHGESDKCRFGNPPQESNFQRLGITVCGSVEAMRTSFTSFGLGLLLSVLLIYLVLVAQFKSFIDPFIILLAVPPGVA